MGGVQPARQLAVERLKTVQAEAEDLEEAGNELMLLDDEAVPYVVGECFVHLPKEEVEEKLERGEGPPGMHCQSIVHLGLSMHHSVPCPTVLASGAMQRS